MTPSSCFAEPLQRLRLEAKEMHFQRRALDIIVTEVLHDLSYEPSAEKIQTLRARLLDTVDQRQRLVLDVLYVEVEIELMLQRERLGDRLLLLLPRCADFFLDEDGPADNGCGGDGGWLSMEKKEESPRPWRDPALIPSDLRVVGVVVDECVPDVKKGPEREIREHQDLYRQRSLKALVRRLTPRRLVPSPVAAWNPS